MSKNLAGWIHNFFNISESENKQNLVRPCLLIHWLPTQPGITRLRAHAHVWQAIPARKRHHLDAYHLHYAVKNAVKCRKNAVFYAVMRKIAPLFTPQLSLSRARVKSAVLNIKPRVKYGAFVHITTP